MKFLIVVDMQNDFIDGSLGSKEAQSIVPRVIEKIKGFDGCIVATQDTHKANYLTDGQEGAMLPVVHCVGGTNGWLLNQDVFKAITDARYNDGKVVDIIPKETFGSVKLADDLFGLNDEEPIEEITLVGLCTDICVVSNALLMKAFMPDVPIKVDASCCAGVTPESHRHALATMKMCQIIVENEGDEE